MKVQDLGEFALIERLGKAIGATADERLIAGIGDDAAVWRSGDAFTVATTDTMVAGVHFLPGAVPWREVGWKALAVNISDIAAMGAAPSFALVTLCVPSDARVEDVDALYAGIGECAEVYNVTVAGGDVVASTEFVITIALCGGAAADSNGQPMLLRRDGARVGDMVAVTGPLGGSGGGLRLLKQGAVVGHELRDDDAAPVAARDVLLAAHVHPVPRIDAGAIAVRAGIRCGIDISDGLMQDLDHVCRASAVSAELQLDALPVLPELREVFPDEATAMAATGGEDYELVLVGGEGALRIAQEAVRERTETGVGPELHIIGRITDGVAGTVRVLDVAGREVSFPTRGWDHFSPRTDA